MDIAQIYAKYAKDLNFDDLPLEVVDHTKKLILDIMGNDIGGYEWMDSGPSIVNGIRHINRGNSGSTVLATGEKMAPEWASFANASMAHSLDYDNHHAKGVIHAGGSVVNCALAAAEENNSNGKELITSVVIGYEIACRLAMALGPHSSHEMGFHPTGTCATFSGSAIIGRSRKMSEEEIVNAMGLNGSQAAGSMQYVFNGAWNKRTHPGINTHSSFIAATLAQSGFIGAAEVFEGKQGFLQGYALRPIPENATKTLGKSYETLENAIKPFPLCRYNHQTLDLVIDYQKKYDVETSKISSIIIDMPTYGVQLCGSPIELKRNPKSAVDAQFSGCFAAALALTQEKADMKTFTNVLNTGMSAEFRRLLSITDIQQADDLDAIHPEFWPGRVTLIIDGEKVELYGKHMRGEKERPMTIVEVQEKFRDLSPNHDESKRMEVFEVINNLENATIDDLLSPLRK
ncbi:MAG: MmgE/PrpD family protein [Hyphomicrobiales bacterium]|jgi:2-methylcitrate dehydratase PrpD|nr:MmgE/PrpD family protein [Hyphomicrobiales bacterium]|tara:strand:- start:267 stop:1643 length:1377 start_codon:yes stop_codon:yes gene_type:complete